MVRHVRAALGPVLAAAALALAASPARGPGPLPPLVYAARVPPPGRVVPGLGPAQRLLAPGGRLVLRSADGAERDLLAPGTMWDCASPAPNPDARRLAFAGTVHPDSAWRIFVVGVDGTGLAAVTGPARGFASADTARFDDV